MAHYYEQVNGQVEPRHFVPVKSRPGDLRPSTIRDARAGRWHPSVTTILGLLSKPALTNWLIDEHLKDAWLLDRNYDDQSGWAHQVKLLTEKRLAEAPDAGSDVHDSLEQWFLGKPIKPEHRAICENVTATINAHCPGETWLPERSFVHPSGFGGKVDLHSPNWVIDYKSKQTADKFRPGKMVFDEHPRQLAAYRRGVGYPAARCANVFICIETAEVEFVEHAENTLQIEWLNFSDLLNIWLRQAGYQPGVTP